MSYCRTVVMTTSAQLESGFRLRLDSNAGPSVRKSRVSHPLAPWRGDGVRDEANLTSWEREVSDHEVS